MLARFPECLALLENLSPHERMLVRQVLASIVEGQAWDLMYFESHAAVSCPEQLEHYTYMVAGCVGEILDQAGFAGSGAGLQHAAGGAAFALGQALRHGAAVGEYSA
ncbi:MAG: hypothetical protein ACLT4Z_01930 [Akkermansia muciniphila]